MKFELADILDFDDWMHDTFARVGDRFVPILVSSEFPISSMSLVGLMSSANSIKLGIYDLAESCETHLYVLKILQRSLIEQFLRFQYILFRCLNEERDEVGLEYRKYSKISEILSYVNASSVAASMVGKPTEDVILKKLKKEYPDLSVSKKQLNEITGKWKHRSIIRYIKNNSNIADKQAGFLLGLIPKYAELSSFVHGGTSAEEFYHEVLDAGALKAEVYYAVEDACMIAALMKAFLLMLVVRVDASFKDDFNHLMSKLLEFSCTVHKSGKG